MDARKSCIVCGTNYRYCEGCPAKYNVKETWRNLFCSENCREIYHVYDMMKAHQISDEDANKLLVHYDTKHISAFNEPIRSALVTVMKSRTKKITAIAKADNEENPTPKKRGRKKKNDEVN